MVRVPEGAKCARKGKLFSAWEWEQKQFDGSVKIFEGVKRFDSIQGIMIDGDNIVLPYEIQPARTEWNYGLWGGMLEEGEIPDEAMVREFLEETGMIGDITFWKTLSKTGYVSRDEHFYIIRNAKKIQEPTPDSGGEKIEMRKVSFDEFIAILIDPGFRNSTFANAMIREYILPREQEEFRKILFGK